MSQQPIAFDRRSGDSLVQVIAHKLESLHGDVGDMKQVLRDLTTAVTKLAIVEERQGQAAISLERAFKVLEKVEGRLDALERREPMNTQASEWVTRAVFAAAAVAVLYVARQAGL